MSFPCSPPSRLAVILLVLGSFCASSLCSSTAEARLLWKGKGRKKAPQSAPAQSAPSTAPAPSQPRAAKARTKKRAAATGANPAFETAATLLGAQADGVPPAQPHELTRLGHELRRLKEPASALETARGEGSQARASLNYGNVLAQLGYDSDAALAYQQAIRLDQELLAARANMGALMRRAGLLEEARILLNDVLVRSPNHALGWFNLALTEERLENVGASDQAYLEALRLDPSLWLPSKNPLIVGNKRANAAIHRNYLQRQGGDKILLDGGP